MHPAPTGEQWLPYRAAIPAAALVSHGRSPASATKPVAAWPLGYEFGNIPLMFFFFCRLRNLALELVD